MCNLASSNPSRTLVIWAARGRASALFLGWAQAWLGCRGVLCCLQHALSGLPALCPIHSSASDRAPNALARTQASARQSPALLPHSQTFPVVPVPLGHGPGRYLWCFFCHQCPIFWPSSVISTNTHLFEKLPNCFLKLLDYFTFLPLMSQDSGFFISSSFVTAHFLLWSS